VKSGEKTHVTNFIKKKKDAEICKHFLQLNVKELLD